MESITVAGPLAASMAARDEAPAPPRRAFSDITLYLVLALLVLGAWVFTRLGLV